MCCFVLFRRILSKGSAVQMRDFFLNLTFTFFFNICLCVPTAKSIDSPGAEDFFSCAIQVEWTLCKKLNVCQTCDDLIRDIPPPFIQSGSREVVEEQKKCFQVNNKKLCTKKKKKKKLTLKSDLLLQT